MIAAGKIVGAATVIAVQQALMQRAGAQPPGSELPHRRHAGRVTQRPLKASDVADAASRAQPGCQFDGLPADRTRLLSIALLSQRGGQQ